MYMHYVIFTIGLILLFVPVADHYMEHDLAMQYGRTGMLFLVIGGFFEILRLAGIWQ